MCYNSLEKRRSGVSGVFEDIERLNGGKMNFGTERTRALLDALGSPDDRLKIIHIAGTNGKGSAAEYISRTLAAAGRKVGTFTSPPVLDCSEQFSIDGKPLCAEKAEKYMEKAYAAAENCTSFEVTTAAALYAFAQEGCEYAVVECGLGGLLDATNAVRKKELAVITSIGLEHTAVLGATLEEICAHKSGIIRGCPAVVSALQPEAVLSYFKKLNVIFADKPLEILTSGFSGQSFLYGGDKFEIKMAGFAQAYNAAVAIEAARLLKIPENAIRTGLSAAFLAGRLQYFKAGGNEYIVDGSHNPASFAPLAAELKKYDPEKVTLIFGCLSDKDIESNLSALEGLAGRIFAVQPKSPRAMDIDKIYSACKKRFPAAEVAESVSSALEKSDGAVVVCGSFTLVKEAVSWIEKRL